ncbi:hypothetical protein D3C76_1615660 [compost metagenome]
MERTELITKVVSGALSNITSMVHEYHLIRNIVCDLQLMGREHDHVAILFDSLEQLS